ncbi:MAG: arylsulfatase [Fermentimonas sp.]
MKQSIVLGLSILASTSVFARKQNPNVIFILADDLGYGDLACYGQTKIETPNIDALAKEGICFTQYYSGSPVSAPSRCVLLTGKHTGHAYIRGNDEMADRGNVWSHQAMLDNALLEGQRPMPASTFTIPRMFKQKGYVTACVGKWGLGHPGSESTPTKMGFDFFYGYNCQRQAHTYYPPFLYRNEQREYLNNKRIIQPGEKHERETDFLDENYYQKFTQNDYAPDLMFREILSFVDENKHNNFLLMWTTPIPHVPLQGSKRWVDYYVNKFGEEQPYFGDLGYYPIRFPHASYAAMISYLDEQIGILVKHLKDNGLYENTVLIFTSDNGPTFNGGADSPWFRSAGPFKCERGWGKASLHEGGIRVPFIVSWPSRIEPERVSDHVCAAWDIMPTLAEILDVNVNTDGISLLPELIGLKQIKTHDYLYWEYPESGGSIAIRMHNWKGIISNINKGNERMRLFNLDSDPSESFDLANQYPDIIASLKENIRNARISPEVEKFKFIFDK